MGPKTNNVSGLCDGEDMLRQLLIFLSVFAALPAYSTTATKNWTIDDLVSAPQKADTQHPLSQATLSFGLISPSNTQATYKHFCAASVVAPQILLTAAHCIESLELFLNEFSKLNKLPPHLTNSQKLSLIKKKNLHFVATQEKSVSNNPKITLNHTHKIVNFAKHPLYKDHDYKLEDGTWIGQREYDIAVVYLDRPLKVKPIAIAQPRQTMPQNLTVLTYGFDWQLKNQLQFTEAHRSEEFMSILGTSFAQVDSDDKRFFVPVAINRTSCQETAGGPKYAMINGRWTIVSVVSGAGAQECDSPALSQNEISKLPIDLKNPFDSHLGLAGENGLAYQDNWLLNTIQSNRR